MSVILTEEEYRQLQNKPCDKCAALKQRFDDAGVELLRAVLSEWALMPPDEARNIRLRDAGMKFSRTL